jgi:heme ABC exporter ATP-binding subunit CcmA
LKLDFSSLTFSDVTLDFRRRRALNRVSLSLTGGEIVAVLGPNGAGKTTLLMVAATLLTPTSGTVRFGEWTSADGGDDLRRVIGLVGHDLYVYADLSARQNLRFFADLYRVDRASERVDAAVRQAGLEGRGHESIATFSRGMRQRLAIERALIHDPRLVLLDEPFTGLDEASSDMLKARLRELRERGCMVVVTTHDIEAVDGLVDRAMLLLDGRLSRIEAGQAPLRERYRRQCAV